MLKRDYEGQNCSVASALEIVGERWTLLIIRDAFAGLSRFEEFRESLGLARNVLTDRLDKLVEHGIFERVPYGDRADRFDYRLTQKGLDLHVALVGLRQWGDKYLCDKPPTVLRRASDKKRLIAALVPTGTKTVPVQQAEGVAGPGRDPSASTWQVVARRS
jgi:DNA-binding HxlR family transcriptional regulator